MKLKIFVLKKKQLYLAAIILGILIISIILFVSIKTSSTIGSISIPSNYKADVNNDGKPDTVMVKTNSETQTYSVNVVCSDSKEYSLESDPIIHMLGSSANNIPIKVTFSDINKDGCDEIFVQGADSKGPILTVFEYKNKNINRIASGRYIFYGLINNKNEDNVLALGRRNYNKLQITYLDCQPDSLTTFTNKKVPTLGINTINAVLNYIEQPDMSVANVGVDNSELSMLSKGKVIDGVLDSFNSDEPILSFNYKMRIATEKNAETKVENYKISLIPDNNNENNYKITSISKSN